MPIGSPSFLLPALLLFQTPAAAPRGEAAQALEMARRALEQGDSRRALEHVERARLSLPAEREPLELALRASAQSADERALWSLRTWSALADVDGKLELDAQLRALLSDAPWLEGLSRARAAALAELARFAESREASAARAPDESLVARWARQLALDLAEPSPALRASLPAYHGWTRVDEGVQLRALRALEKHMQGSAASGKLPESLRAARVLHGLAVQAGFEDLQDQPPRDMSGFEKSSSAALARARATLATRQDDPWSVEDLEWLSSEEGDAFSRAHPDFATPALALSPQGRYRIETDCGAETLLGVASTIELHHARLASWFGSDPFLERQGLVRVVPQASGLESEGAPFWWAGGFQAGDTTTVRFSCGTIEGLGHGLTHELTHRFDGALYPGIPAWLAEGRAVWTGAAFARASDERFIDRHASFGTIEAAFVKGYGGLDKLADLVSGELEDYRDNYTAGYALYVYLATWDPAKGARFAPRLTEYMRRCGGPKAAPRDLFEQFFCDGREARPKDLEAFAADFAQFVSGFYWRDRKPFTEAYVADAGEAPATDYVYDGPTWVWSRARAEPYFGQEQALLAARLLAATKDESGASDAYLWALAADGRLPAGEREFEQLCLQRNRRDAAWCLRTLRRFPRASVEADAPPFLGQLPRLKAYESALLSARDAAATASLPACAQQLAAERERVAAHLGLALQPIPPLAATPAGPTAFGASARLLHTGGFVEDGLTGFEERRVRDLWYLDGEGSLHVGRTRPRSGSGQIDRGAAQRDAFARSREWNLPGAWRLDARIRLTTSFASGAVVLGYQRREQAIRLGFSGGDFLVAIGAKDQEPSFESVGWNLSSGFERDGALRSNETAGQHAFGGTRTSFELTLLVDGPRVEAFIDGERVGSLCVADGTPIQGYIGFATGMGAIAVSEARVRRLDLERSCGAQRLEPSVLSLTGSASVGLRESQGRVLEGFEAPSQGALLVVVPLPEGATGLPPPDERWWTRVQLCGEDIAEELERAPISQPVWLCLPRGTLAAAPPELGALIPRFAALGPGRAELREVDAPGAIAEPDGEELRGRMPTALYLDSSNLVRRTASFSKLRSLLRDRAWRHWLEVFRENQAPARALPAPVRRSRAQPEER